MLTRERIKIFRAGWPTSMPVDTQFDEWLNENDVQVLATDIGFLDDRQERLIVYYRLPSSKEVTT